MLHNSVTMITTMNSSANSSLHPLRNTNFDNRNNQHKISSSKRDEDHHHHKKKEEEEDGQIEVFEAQKYFNGGMDLESPRLANVAATKQYYHQYQYQKDEEEYTDMETRKYSKSHHYGTPSVRSEASWNSQSKLLRSTHQKNYSSGNNRKSKVQGKSFLAGLGCKCSCTDKNSVDISDHNKTPKTIFKNGPDAGYVAKPNKPHESLLFNKDVYFHKPDVVFSAVNSGLENHLENMKLQQEEEEEKKPRKSLEVFGSPILNSRRSVTFDKRPTMPTWDASAAAAAPKMEEIDLCAGNYNDTESDASSDLFEIDSLTGKSNQFLNNNRQQTSEVASGCASPTTGYAPSEASIEWSVATASAAEYSVMSDNEEQQRPVATTPKKKTFTSSNRSKKASRETQKKPPGILLGCKSHKAVIVAGDAFITYEKPNFSPLVRRRSDSLPQVTRFKASDTKIGNFGAIHAQHAYAKPPLRRSYSTHASQLLYI